MIKIEQLRQNRASKGLQVLDDLTTYFLSVHFSQKDREMIAKLKNKEYSEGFKNGLTLNK